MSLYRLQHRFLRSWGSSLRTGYTMCHTSNLHQRILRTQQLCTRQRRGSALNVVGIRQRTQSPRSNPGSSRTMCHTSILQMDGWHRNDLHGTRLVQS